MPDGWGITAFRDGHRVLNEKELKPAYQSSQYDETVEKLKKTLPDIVLAHLRLDSVGSISSENCHPFHYGNWSFMHNGSVPAAFSEEITRAHPVN